MVFFLSKLPKDEVDSFFIWAYEYCDKQEASYKERLFEPLQYLKDHFVFILKLTAVCTYLRNVWEGKASEKPCIMLGWTYERHMLVPEKAKK